MRWHCHIFRFFDYFDCLVHKDSHIVRQIAQRTCDGSYKVWIQIWVEDFSKKDAPKNDNVVRSTLDWSKLSKQQVWSSGSYPIVAIGGPSKFILKSADYSLGNLASVNKLLLFDGQVDLVARLAKNEIYFKSKKADLLSGTEFVLQLKRLIW